MLSTESNEENKAEQTAAQVSRTAVHCSKVTMQQVQAKQNYNEQLYILSAKGKWRRTMQGYDGMGTEEAGLQMWTTLWATGNENTAGKSLKKKSNI